jgi:hypothetical protein
VIVLRLTRLTALLTRNSYSKKENKPLIYKQLRFEKRIPAAGAFSKAKTVRRPRLTKIPGCREPTFGQSKRLTLLAPYWFALLFSRQSDPPFVGNFFLAVALYQVCQRPHAHKRVNRLLCIHPILVPTSVAHHGLPPDKITFLAVLFRDEGALLVARTSLLHLGRALFHLPDDRLVELSGVNLACPSSGKGVADSSLPLHECHSKIPVGEFYLPVSIDERDEHRDLEHVIRVATGPILSRIPIQVQVLDTRSKSFDAGARQLLEKRMCFLMLDLGTETKVDCGRSGVRRWRLPVARPATVKFLLREAKPEARNKTVGSLLTEHATECFLVNLAVTDWERGQLGGAAIHLLNRAAARVAEHFFVMVVHPLESL